MSEMIERVAGIASRWFDVSPSTGKVFAEHLLAAMREPTDAMIDRGGEVECYAGNELWPGPIGLTAKEVFTAMIDAALRTPLSQDAGT